MNPYEEERQAKAHRLTVDAAREAAKHALETFQAMHEYVAVAAFKYVGSLAPEERGGMQSVVCAAANLVLAAHYRLLEVCGCETQDYACVGCLRAEADSLREQLREVCEAAIRYDDSIAGKAARGEANLREAGGGVVTGDDLDALYNDWISKARKAMEGLK